MISIVIPCFNEADNLPHSLPIILEELRKITENWQMVLVDDGSTDHTGKIIGEFKDQVVLLPTEEIINLRFRQNYGHMQALRAGISVAKYDWVVTMDSDLQDPPGLIIGMIAKAKESGACLVSAKRASRDHDSIFKKFTAKIFYKLAEFVSGNAIPQDVADFRLMHRCVVDFVNNTKESTFVFRLMLPAQGFKTAFISFDRPARNWGKTKYSFRKMLRLAVEAFLAYGVRPLRLCGALGVLLGVFTFFLGIIQIIVYLSGNSVPGVPSILLPMLFLNSFILISIGLLGEYLGLVLREIRGRDSYVVENCARRLNGDHI